MSAVRERRHAVLRVGPVSLRRDLWGATTLLLMVLVTAATGVVAITLGDYPLSIPQVLDVLLGGGRPFDRTVVLEWRLPRILLAIITGAALGVSGAIFQTLTRNPLGSPDIIGFTSGAYAGVLVVTLLLSAAPIGLVGGALVGGGLTAATIYLLAWRGGVAGFRLILVGIGVTALLEGFNAWVILKGDLEEAMSVALWGRGTLTGTTTGQVVLGAVGVGVLLLGVAATARLLRGLELGDDRARSLGIAVEGVRALAGALAVGLVAVTVATVGPIAFVALAAPQIAARLVRAEGMCLTASAVVGALVLVLADLIAQHAFPTQVPVGVVTVVIGGAYLVWLLIHESRRRSP